MVLDSSGLGWRNAYASITAARVWTGEVAAIEHPSLAYCLRGTNLVERRIDGEAEPQIVHFRARRFGIMPTHAQATYSVRGGADVLMIYLRASMMRETIMRMGEPTGVPIHLTPVMNFLDPLLEQICLEFAAALHRQDASRDAAYVDRLAEMAAAHCWRNYRFAQSGAKDAASCGPPLPGLVAGVERVRLYVDEHLDSDLSLDRLARVAETKPSLLTQAFVELHSATPHQFVIRRRLEAARRLLIVSSLPISEIALQTGFASQSHLSVAFKRATGETPNRFRRAK